MEQSQLGQTDPAARLVPEALLSPLYCSRVIAGLFGNSKELASVAMALVIAGSLVPWQEPGGQLCMPPGSMARAVPVTSSLHLLGGLRQSWRGKVCGVMSLRTWEDSPEACQRLLGSNGGPWEALGGTVMSVNAWLWVNAGRAGGEGRQDGGGAMPSASCRAPGRSGNLSGEVSAAVPAAV